MAQAEKRKESISEGGQDPTHQLIAAVLDAKKSLPEAEAALRGYVNGLAEDEAVEWRGKAVARARRLMSVAEGFAQLLTVIAAGQ